MNHVALFAQTNSLDKDEKIAPKQFIQKKKKPPNPACALCAIRTGLIVFLQPKGNISRH
jgi:hypothetical protein